MAEVKRQTKPPIIEVKDFDFYYNGGSKKVLKDINMKIKEKTVTAFIGPSGCGKSTLLRSINRMNDLVPNIVVDGELFFNEKNIYDPGVDVTRLRTDIGMECSKKRTRSRCRSLITLLSDPRSQGIKIKKS
jgi:phosphate transport system ATP-binding protein